MLPAKLAGVAIAPDVTIKEPSSPEDKFEHYMRCKELVEYHQARLRAARAALSEKEFWDL